ncbi:hypothetical protein ACHWQZ_G008148 [Mnemiopsis leidyi]
MKNAAIPKFDGTNYKRWKDLVRLWEKVTEMDDAKKGPALILHMSGSAQDIALAANPEGLTVDALIKLLDNVYAEDNDLALKCDEFDRLVRGKDQSMKEFIHVYEQKIKELQAGKVEIPEIVLATKILRAANLPMNHYLIVRSSCSEMKLQSAKEALLRISEKCPSSKTTTSDQLDFIQVKEETLDFEHPTMMCDTDYGIHNTFYGHDLDRRDILYSGSNNRRQGSNRSNSKQCFGCGESTHWIKDCPRVNSTNRNPNRQCYGCGDNSHWIKDCPHLKDIQALIQNMKGTSYGPRKYTNTYSGNRSNSTSPRTFFTEEEKNDSDKSAHQSEEENDQSNLKIFFQSDVGNEAEDILLLGETINKAVLDSGASRTVCGKEWYDCYVDSLSQETKAGLKELPSNTVFKFGVGKLKADKVVHLPVKLCDKEILLEVHVVQTDIPLLLSLQTMKKMGMQIDFERDRVALDEGTYGLEITSSGHYTLSLTQGMEKNPDVYVSVPIQDGESEPNTNTKKKALKLHRRFAHAKSKRIIKLLENAGKKDKNLEKELEKLDQSCEFCLKHQRASPRPTVSLPLATKFNELIAMDLKQIKGKWVLHCIDYLTRFSAAHVVRSHDPEEIIEKFFTIWVSIFGTPEGILSDNGGEFQGRKWEPICDAFGIRQKTTAAEAPFSNGVCERHNMLIGEMTEKTMDDVGCSLQTALMWAVHAKNSLINIYGFSPYQLVFGYNPSIPGIPNNKLPALSSETSSKMVASQINSLRTARMAYIKAENSERIARALRGRVYDGTHKRFCAGDTVYYKRLGQKTWCGPGTVIAQIGNEVLVKSGSGRYVKVHPCKLALKQVVDKTILPNVSSRPGDIPEQNTHESSSESETEDEEEGRRPLIHEEHREEITEIVNDPERAGSENESSLVTDKERKLISAQMKASEKILKKGDKIFYKLAESEKDWNVAEIIGRGGKKSGTLSNYWNIKNLRSGSTMGINLDEVDWIKDDTKFADINILADQVSWEAYIQNCEYDSKAEHRKAKEAEIQKWKKFGVFEEVKKGEYPDQEPLSCRWVDESKLEDNKMKCKFRLVARGFQESDAPMSDSPTAQKSVMRMCIIICNMFGWKLESLDIRAAFLQSNELDRTVLLIPPKEFRKDSETVWRIKKPIYGLNDGARKWFLTMKKKLTHYGCTPLNLDPSVFVYHVDGQLSGFCVLHVDDFLIGGNNKFHDNVVNKLSNEFEISSRNHQKFTYVGWDIIQKCNSIEVDQITYQEGIKQIQLNGARSKQTDYEGSQEEKRQYQQLLGKLQWISSQSRPDIRFSVLECSLKANKPQVKDILKINKVVKKMNKNTVRIVFGVPTCSLKEDLKILAFSDAALSNLPDKTSSTRSFVIFLSAKGKVAPLSWSCRKLERVAKTIIYAEGIALGKCLDEAVNLRQAMLQMLCLTGSKSGNEIIPIIGVTDSKSLWDNIYSSSQAQDLKLRREVASIREQLEMKEVQEVKWIPTELQLADCLTKGTASPDGLIHVLTTGQFNIHL